MKVETKPQPNHSSINYLVKRMYSDVQSVYRHKHDRKNKPIKMHPINSGFNPVEARLPCANLRCAVIIIKKTEHEETGNEYLVCGGVAKVLLAGDYFYF